LFGWSKSSKRGTSAWAAPPRSLDGSRLPTPETSDDEDGGDYDNVLGYLSDGYISPVATRSRAGSYADLQKLKMSKTAGATLAVPTAVPGPAPTADPGRPRSGSVGSSPGGSPRTKRARGNSLTEVVPVQEINKCDKSQPFEEMTEQLNHASHKSAE
jgi:glycerol-3-phosphate O-acyltransferase/dihydroxyacetone phosphate acyltransferase